MVYHSCNLWNFLSLYCFCQGNISQQSMLWELLSLSYSWVVYPVCTSKLWTLLSLPVSSFTTAGVINCIPLKIPSKWYIRGLIVHRSHLRKIWYFPRAVKGLKFQRSYTGQLHFPNLPDAQDNKQHDVKRLNHGSLMLIIFSCRGRFDSFGR